MKALLGLSLLALAACAAAAPAPSAADECGAAHAQYLIGRQRSDIPPPPPGARWRIACTTCMITMDYVAARLNIFFNEKTGLIEKVRCG